ncbi:hypothetical protein RSOLAG22IIIB_03635 [Rhizoctonia solani]|uniref:Cyclin-like domain-containing protein n=1 Tax=Rhizoctonia solani TaxID=456999 RepID=A0A0K6FR82_9AGAM|nr:hypothetical protein RSOLAG22IIIB_03635 [Rhizoctonia solani]
MSNQVSPARTPPPTATVRIREHNAYFSEEEVGRLAEKTRGNVSEARGERLRQQSCTFIDAVGVRSGFPRRTIATAQNLYHRFHMFFSMKDFDFFDVTMACLYVSTKLHDTLKKPRDILMAAYCIRMPELAAKSKTGTDVDIDQTVLETDRHRLIAIERLILETICFNFRVRLPFAYVIKICREFHASKELTKLAWRLSIDSNRTLVPLQYPPHTIALGCIYLAALLMSTDPNGPATSPTYDSREHSFRGDDPSMIVAKLTHPGEWETKFYSRVEQLEDIAHALLDLLLLNPSSASLHTNTSPTTPSSPSPSQQQSQLNPTTSTVPANYSTSQLTRLKIQLREQEQQEQRDRRPARVRVRSVMDADMMNGLNGVGDSSEGTVVSHGDSKSVLSTKSLKLSIDWSDGCPRLQWFSALPERASPDGSPFLSDCVTRAYTFDAATGGVLHYVEREEGIPVSEHEKSPACPLGPNDEPFVNDRRNEFVYGLGEASGGILRTARKFTLEARDGAGYDWENGDPLYKVTPFYIVFNKKTRIWCGVYYNSLANDASLDFGAECDALFNGFRTYRAGSGPLDYYVILGDGTLPSVISTYAALVSPSLSFHHPKTHLSDVNAYFKPWRASLTLPPRSQFGYLASSLALAAEPHAQDAVLDFVKTCRKKGFPIDALHLSTGWCQNPETDNRHYFVWNRQRYPDPRALGTALEQEMNIRIIVNIKPWLLDDHPLYEEALKGESYVRAAEDADSDIGVAKSLLWSNAPGEHMYGSYLDFSSPGAVEWWSRHIKEDIVGMNMTGMWIDNNEYSGLVDDAEVYVGKNSFWGGGDWESRLGWGGGEIFVGQAGRLIQMMGMAKTTYDTMLEIFPERRPIIVTRAAIPGMQAYAHGTWSGDNATSWIALRRGTAMTLSAGISFLPGLYGHDIGGFAGKHHPSPELLVRWCQQGAWHTRFTVHSWKEVSTTLWMYDGVKVDGTEITSILRDVVGFRYQLIPSMYSLYVNEYWKQGWPVLRPMFWYHSADPKTLALDEQFLFGSHVLVAPVLSFEHRTKRVYLPSAVDGTDETPEWCELDTGAWHTSPSEGGFINMDAPLSRTPVLVRAGGILVLSNKCTDTVYDGGATRVAHIFPSIRSQADGSKGTFKLVEDDGKTNEHTENGAFTELELNFQVSPGEKAEQEIEVDVKELNNSYTLPYDVVWFILPLGDNRKLRVPAGSTRKTSEQKADDGRAMLGVHLA